MYLENLETYALGNRAVCHIGGAVVLPLVNVDISASSDCKEVLLFDLTASQSSSGLVNQAVFA
jgi:hypothetical protein